MPNKSEDFAKALADSRELETARQRKSDKDQTSRQRKTDLEQLCLDVTSRGMQCDGSKQAYVPFVQSLVRLSRFAASNPKLVKCQPNKIKFDKGDKDGPLALLVLNEASEGREDEAAGMLAQLLDAGNRGVFSWLRERLPLEITGHVQAPRKGKSDENTPTNHD